MKLWAKLKKRLLELITTRDSVAMNFHNSFFLSCFRACQRESSLIRVSRARRCVQSVISVVGGKGKRKCKNSRNFLISRHEEREREEENSFITFTASVEFFILPGQKREKKDFLARKLTFSFPGCAHKKKHNTRREESWASEREKKFTDTRALNQWDFLYFLLLLLLR